MDSNGTIGIIIFPELFQPLKHDRPRRAESSADCFLQKVGELKVPFERESGFCVSSKNWNKWLADR